MFHYTSLCLFFLETFLSFYHSFLFPLIHLFSQQYDEDLIEKKDSVLRNAPAKKSS